jgi:hypothetical protein
VPVAAGGPARRAGGRCCNGRRAGGIGEFGARRSGRHPRGRGLVLGEAEERHRLAQLPGLPDSSSEVEASSSDAAAFCCVALLSWPIELAICDTDWLCSLEAAAISCTSSLVFWIAGHDLAEQTAGALGGAHAVGGEVADLLGGLLAALGELAHLGGHDREALAVLAGARGLDGGVERQQVGLVGDVVDDGDLLRDLLHRRHRLP